MEAESLRNQLLDSHRTLGWMDLVIANIEDGVCAIDKNGTLIYANDAFATFAGEQRVFLLGTKFWEVIRLYSGEDLLSEQISADPTLLYKFHRAGGIYELKNNQATYFVTLAANYIKTLDQTVIMIRNVTAQRELDLMRSRFISLTSHQLRTPLSVINVYLNMLNDGYQGELNEGQQELVNNVLSGLDQMQLLVANLLDTGRVEQGKVTLNKTPLDMNTLMTKIVQDIQPRLKEKDISLSVRIPKAVPTIVSDAHHLQEIVSNLIVNSVQYSHSGGKVSVALTANKLKNLMTIAIKDYGIGIPKENQAQIFSPFYRADNAITHYTSGTGLGLYTVKLLLAELGGTIDFKSTETVGTTFFIRIPL